MTLEETSCNVNIIPWAAKRKYGTRMETSARRLGNEVSAGNTDVRRENVQREQGRRARLIDTVTEEPRGREKIERGRSM